MDFHSLTRKELQTLCKRNKIPANLTNVAMADALKALEIVEGLDEFITQSQSPEKTMNKPSQEVPFTVTRTSTRRKTAKEGPQSTQPTTRTRGMTRKTLELDEENKIVNVQTPVIPTTTRRRAQKTEPKVEEQKKSDLLETPALQSGRRRAGVGSTRRKVEAQKEEGSVQQGYGTRRSVRLLDKCMAGLSLKESGRMEPVEIGEVVEREIEENKNGQSGAKSEVPLARNLSVSLEDEGDLKNAVLDNGHCYNGENDCTVISEAGSQNSDNLNSLSAIDTKDESPNEKTDMSDGTIDPKGSGDVAVPVDAHEIYISNVELVADNNGGSHADETKLIGVLISKAFEDVSEVVLDHASFAEVMEPIAILSGEEYANHAPQETECQNLVGKDCDINVVMQDNQANDDLAKLPEAEECDEGKVSENVSVLHEGLIVSSEKLENEEYEDAPDHVDTGSNIIDALHGDSDIDDDSSSVNSSFAEELEEEASCEHKSISIATTAHSSEDPMTSMVNEEALIDVNVAEAETDQIVTGSNIIDAFQGDSDSDDDSSSDNNSFADELKGEASCERKSISIATAAHFSEDPMTNLVNEEALIDVDVAEAETIHVVETSFFNAPQSVAADISVEKIPDYDGEALFDFCIMPAEEFAETNQEIPPQEKSPAAAKLMSPPSPLTAKSSQLTRFTPRKSSSKKQTTISKGTQVSDINKENIDDNSVKEVEPSIAKLKKSKNIIDEETMQKLESMSLRDLKKLAKKFDKLQIADNMKNKEDKNDNSKQQPFGKTRPALQTLPQNCMDAGEAEKEN